MSFEEPALKFQRYGIAPGVPDPVVNSDYRGHGKLVGFPDTHGTLLEVPKVTPEFLAFLTTPITGTPLSIVNLLFAQATLHIPGQIGDIMEILGIPKDESIRACLMDE